MKPQRLYNTEKGIKMDAIVVTVNVPLDIDFTQLMEQRLDAALTNIGFKRTETSKNGDGSTTFKFYQYGAAV